MRSAVLLTDWVTISPVILSKACNLMTGSTTFPRSIATPVGFTVDDWGVQVGSNRIESRFVSWG